MAEYSIYNDITNRTGGDVYIGVVGPVRTGKSTFIKKIMDTLVIPNIEDEYLMEQALDELPQSASGKTIMTTEPEIVRQGSRFGVRLKVAAPSIHIMCNKPKFLKTA